METARVMNIEASWKKQLSEEFEKNYMKELSVFLESELAKDKVIYPQPSEYFAAFESTPFKKVKVVIVGQDPYHGPGQAHGLSFSVKPGVKVPPSLKNIYKEIHRDFHGTMDTSLPLSGDLTSWAEQGVLMLNSVLTVEQAKAASHRKRGWETFTDAVIKRLNEREIPIVFMLWGNYAQKKAESVDREKHCVLTSVHPSPLSAHRGFIGCGHFSQANEFLLSKNLKPIDWGI